MAKKTSEREPKVGDKVLYTPHKDHLTDAGVVKGQAWPAVVVEDDTPDGKRLALEIKHPGLTHPLVYPLEGQGAVPHDAEGAPHSYHFRREGDG